MSQPVTQSEALRILKAHSMETRINSAGDLEALEVGTIRDDSGAVRTVSEWVTVGLSVNWLRCWLGY